MIIKNVNALPEDRQVKFTGGVSLRPIIESDNMGFGLCKTLIPKGGPHHWHYQNHLEACYCIKGEGIITNLTTKESYLIFTDVVYLLDSHDDHTFEALEDTVLISVFNPPLVGDESHDENGVYTSKTKTI
jgi:L-ectoine synthase